MCEKERDRRTKKERNNKVIGLIVGGAKKRDSMSLEDKNNSYKNHFLSRNTLKGFDCHFKENVLSLCYSSRTNKHIK